MHVDIGRMEYTTRRLTRPLFQKVQIREGKMPREMWNDRIENQIKRELDYKTICVYIFFNSYY